MTNIVDNLVSEARSWIDTPWRRGLSMKGVGCDCGGLIAGIYASASLNVADAFTDPQFAPWRIPPAPDVLRACLDAYAVCLAPRNRRPGDVGLFTDTLGLARHLAFFTEENTIVHARLDIGRVVEHSLDIVWQRHLVSVHRPDELLYLHEIL